MFFSIGIQTSDDIDLEVMVARRGLVGLIVLMLSSHMFGGHKARIS
jgi:hypothetical protein